MKNYLSILLLIFLQFSCTPKEEAPIVPELDCDCDKVVDVKSFNIVGTPTNPATVIYSTYTTINECTKIQREKTFNTTNSSLVPKIGECR